MVIPVLGANKGASEHALAVALPLINQSHRQTGITGENFFEGWAGNYAEVVLIMSGVCCLCLRKLAKTQE